MLGGSGAARWWCALAVLGSGCAGADIGNGSSFSGAVESVTASATDGDSSAEGDSSASDPSVGTGDASSDGSATNPTDPTDPTATDPTADATTDPTDASTGETSASGTDTGDPCVPAEEVCDGVDNDCDVDIDEDVAGVGDPCDTGNPGACATGFMACVGGDMVCQGGTGGAETCNGVDDDCNAQIDDGNPGGGGACNTGVPGVCAAGTNNCSGGQVVCTQNVGAGGETCDGEDDDCDGAVDDGNPGGGGACNTGLLGVCSGGTNQCQGGVITCAQNVGASGEACGDGLDNDCDGAIDNGCGCAHDLCTTGVALSGACDTCAGSICAVDAFCCNNSWDALCVGEVETVCGSAVCVSPSCAHLVCTAGAALTNGCATCVTSVCAADPFCCATSWDGLCVGEVASVCGLTC